jgi:hypothetical protein
VLGKLAGTIVHALVGLADRLMGAVTPLSRMLDYSAGLVSADELAQRPCNRREAETKLQQSREGGSAPLRAQTRSSYDADDL